MRRSIFCAVAMLAAAPIPATAQVFWQAPDFQGTPLVPGEANMGVALAGATEAEERAGWVWQMRAGLNVAALQCGFDKTLMSQNIYNGIVRNHNGELSLAYETLRSYFKRTTKTPKAAQNALDQYGTKIYSGMSTVAGQYGFCETSSRIGKAALVATRGSFTLFTVERLRELRNSLQPGGEQVFRFARMPAAPLPSFDDRCWDRRGNYKPECGYSYG